VSKRRKWLVAAAALVLVAVLSVVAAAALGIRREIVKLIDDDPAVWLPVIEAFEAGDRENPPPKQAVVFTGSSSIRFWRDLEQQMAPIPVIRRGYGGARMSDVVHYVDRMVIAYDPSAVVLFAGSNDLAGRSSDGTPEELLAGYVRFVEAVHASLPETPIYYLSITPTRMHWKRWPLVRETNELIEAHTFTDERLHFVDTTDLFLADDGKPDPKLFRFDRLHPNRRGYEAWASVIKPVLEAGLHH
jgi:lysophospholipase L1-like esterase